MGHFVPWIHPLFLCFHLQVTHGPGFPGWHLDKQTETVPRNNMAMVKPGDVSGRAVPGEQGAEWEGAFLNL